MPIEVGLGGDAGAAVLTHESTIPKHPLGLDEVLAGIEALSAGLLQIPPLATAIRVITQGVTPWWRAR